MKTFDSARRDLLRLSSMGLAASAASVIPAFAASKSQPLPGALAILFDVRTFGATGDGKTVDSPAINKAIEAAAAAGGGTVFFPGGQLPLLLHPAQEPRRSLPLAGLRHHRRRLAQARRNHRLHGRHLRRRRAQDRWDAYQDYGHNHWHNSLLWGEDISDFSITGPGLIWGKGLSFGAGPGRPPAGAGASGPGFGPEQA